MRCGMKHLITAIITCFCCSMAVYGDIIVTVEPVTITAGSSGSFDIDLANTGSSSSTVGAFTFEISTTNSAISFTGADTSTVLNGYIFAEDSLFGPNLTGPNSGQTLFTSDMPATPFSGTVIDPGMTFGLAHIFFSVDASSAAGAFAISLTGYPATSLSDPDGNSIAIDKFSNGAINITGVNTTVPEPTSLLFLLTGIPLIWVMHRLSPR